MQMYFFNDGQRCLAATTLNEWYICHAQVACLHYVSLAFDARRAPMVWKFEDLCMRLTLCGVRIDAAYHTRSLAQQVV
jgi:hypothetical protein